jgi:hypothetical protein
MQLNSVTKFKSLLLVNLVTLQSAALVGLSLTKQGINIAKDISRFLICNSDLKFLLASGYHRNH